MNEHQGDEQGRFRLSAIMDGEASAEEQQQWWQGPAREDSTRADWHAYHLIGDVLRSPDLASTAQRDQALLARVRDALQGAPVVLAPTALPAAAPAAPERDLQQRPPRRQRRRLWAASAAVVAGFGVVMAAYLGTRVEVVEFPSGIAVSMGQPVEEIRRASVGGAGSRSAAPDGAWALGTPVTGFREILRLPRGTSQQAGDGLQVLYSNGSATISVVVEPFREGQHVPRVEASERLNTLTVQRNGVWLTLSGDVPIGTLHQMALALQPRP